MDVYKWRRGRQGSPDLWYEGPRGRWEAHWVSDRLRTEIAGPLGAWVDWGPASWSWTGLESVLGSVGNADFLVRQDARWTFSARRRALEVHSGFGDFRLIRRFMRTPNLEIDGATFAAYGWSQIRIETGAPVEPTVLALLIHASEMSNMLTID